MSTYFGYDLREETNAFFLVFSVYQGEKVKNFVFNGKNTVFARRIYEEQEIKYRQKGIFNISKKSVIRKIR